MVTGRAEAQLSAMQVGSGLSAAAPGQIRRHSKDGSAPAAAAPAIPRALHHEFQSLPRRIASRWDETCIPSATKHEFPEKPRCGRSRECQAIRVSSSDKPNLRSRNLPARLFHLANLPCSLTKDTQNLSFQFRKFHCHHHPLGMQDQIHALRQLVNRVTDHLAQPALNEIPLMRLAQHLADRQSNPRPGNRR